MEIGMGLPSKDIERLITTYFLNSPDRLFCVEVGDDGRFPYKALNPSALARVGRSLEAVLGQTPEEVIGSDVGIEITTGIRQVVESGKPHRYEHKFAMPGGNVIYDATFAPIRGDSGKVVGVVGYARDITECRRLEALLRRDQKMAALGRLAADVAHDFNNVLAGALGCLELLTQHAAAEKETDGIARCRRVLKRGERLVARLMAYSREQTTKVELHSVAALVDSSTELATPLLGAGVTIHNNPEPELPMVLCDRDQVELALVNLMTNARDAMPNGGSIRIDTRVEEIFDPGPDLVEGRHVAISITDSGCGMAPEVLARAHKPFFTTKEPGKGTGLGLSMAHALARQLRGTLSIASQLGQGTCVTLYLPCEDVGAEGSKVGPVKLKPGRRRTVRNAEKRLRNLGWIENRPSAGPTGQLGGGFQATEGVLVARPS